MNGRKDKIVVGGWKYQGASTEQIFDLKKSKQSVSQSESKGEDEDDFESESFPDSEGYIRDGEPSAEVERSGAKQRDVSHADNDLTFGGSGQGKLPEIVGHTGTGRFGGELV